MKADLHCHTVLSDGAMRVDQIIPYAKRIGLDYIAISDHESAHSIPEAVRLGKELGVHADSFRDGKRWNSDRELHNECAHILLLLSMLSKSYQLSLMDEYPITMDQLYGSIKRNDGVYYTLSWSSFWWNMMGYTGTLCPKEGLHRLILAGEQANKAFYEKHPKFKK